MSAVFASVAMGATAPQALFTNVPANAVPVGYQVFFTDWGANGTLARSNGTRWLPVNGQATLKHLGAGVSGVSTTETIVLQSLIPIGAWQANDSIVYDLTGANKSGTTDSLNVRIRIGTAGTVADTSLGIFQLLTTTAVSGSALYPFKLISNTSVQQVGTSAGQGEWGASGASTVVTGAPVTISDASANALWVSLSIVSTGATNTVAIQEGRILHIAG